MLSVNNAEIQLRQVFRIVNQYMIRGDKILHPLGKAIVKRLQEQVIDVAYVLIGIVLEIILSDARGKVLMIMCPFLVFHTYSVVQCIIPLNFPVISIRKFS